MNHNTTKYLKKYQFLKISTYIKTNTLLFFFLSNKSKAVNWKKNEQTLKKLKLIYYKIINKIILKKLKNSIYKNFEALIGGVILLLAPSTKQVGNVTGIKTKLQMHFSLLCLKLNNKIYSMNEIKKFSDLSYKKNIFFLYRSLEKYSKISHITTSRKTRNNGT